MKSHKQARITLVGAGPGSEDLITIRGIRAIKDADIILYDALVCKELLTYANESIPKLYVGKRCGKHHLSQNEINLLLAQSAFEHGHVVRLKGGDPFIFGRAQEEIDFAESFGIPVTVVPGISSAIAVPECQGIPLTKRGLSTSFWVMTATKKDGSFSEDLTLAAKSSATMVILMGVRKLQYIISEVSQYKPLHTPIAIIQNGTLKDETCIVSTLEKAGVVMSHLDTSKAGIIVIGNVVSDHPSFYKEDFMRVFHSAL